MAKVNSLILLPNLSSIFNVISRRLVTSTLNSLSSDNGYSSSSGVMLALKKGLVLVTLSSWNGYLPWMMTFVELSGNSNTRIISATTPIWYRPSWPGSSSFASFWQITPIGVFVFCAASISAKDLSRPTATGIATLGNNTIFRSAKIGTSDVNDCGSISLSVFSLAFTSVKIWHICGLPSSSTNLLSVKSIIVKIYFIYPIAKKMPNNFLIKSRNNFSIVPACVAIDKNI